MTFCSWHIGQVLELAGISKNYQKDLPLCPVPAHYKLPNTLARELVSSSKAGSADNFICIDTPQWGASRLQARHKDRTAEGRQGLSKSQLLVLQPRSGPGPRSEIRAAHVVNHRGWGFKLGHLLFTSSAISLGV